MQKGRSRKPLAEVILESAPYARHFVCYGLLQWSCQSGARKINNFGVLQAAESNEASINSNGARNSYAESSIVSAIR